MQVEAVILTGINQKNLQQCRGTNGEKRYDQVYAQQIPPQHSGNHLAHGPNIRITNGNGYFIARPKNSIIWSMVTAAYIDHHREER